MKHHLFLSAVGNVHKGFVEMDWTFSEWLHNSVTTASVPLTHLASMSIFLRITQAPTLS